MKTGHNLPNLNAKVSSVLMAKELKFKHLKNEANSLLELTNNPEITNQLTELSKFRSFDELSILERYLIRLLVFRFQLNWIGSWKRVGKYWNDLHSIEIKLRGIQFKLNKTS